MSPEKSTRPTNLRMRVLLFTVSLAVITYIHRVCISQAAPDIQRDLSLSKEQMSYVFSAFTVAYGLFEIPGGWLSDKFGPRRVLSGVVVLWSLFTAATGWAWNLSSMVACRFLLSSRLARRLGSVARTRRVMAYVGMTGTAVMLVLSSQIENPVLAMVVMGLAAFATDLVMPGAWGACMDVGGKYAGSLSGSMNMMGNLGAVVSPIIVAQILKHANNNWTITFYVSAGVYLVGAVCWMFIDPVTPLESDDAAAA